MDVGYWALGYFCHYKRCRTSSAYGRWLLWGRKLTPYWTTNLGWPNELWNKGWCVHHLGKRNAYLGWSTEFQESSVKLQCKSWRPGIWGSETWISVHTSLSLKVGGRLKNTKGHSKLAFAFFSVKSKSSVRGSPTLSCLVSLRLKSSSERRRRSSPSSESRSWSRGCPLHLHGCRYFYCTSWQGQRD